MTKTNMKTVGLIALAFVIEYKFKIVERGMKAVGL